MSTARILVVDDENDIRELVRDILSEEGYAVETAANAAEARAACARQAPGPDPARYLDAGHRRHQPAARVAAITAAERPGRDDVRSRDRRDRGRSHAPWRNRLRRKAPFAREAAAHGSARAGRGEAATPRLAHARAAADRAGRPQPADARPARTGQADRAARGAGAAARRSRHRARGFCALHPFHQPAQFRAVRCPRRRGL